MGAGCGAKAALQAITPEGTQITKEMPKDPFAGIQGWEEAVFAASCSPRFRDEATAQRALDGCFSEVKRIRIFDLKNTQDDGVDKPTKVHFPDGETVAELDMMIAITTWLDVAWCTSLEHVCVLENVPGESFTCCIAGDRENIIDGYYRITARRDGEVVNVNYAKVQSLNGALLRKLVGIDTYKVVAKLRSTFALLTVLSNHSHSSVLSLHCCSHSLTHSAVVLTHSCCVKAACQKSANNSIELLEKHARDAVVGRLV